MKLLVVLGLVLVAAQLSMAADVPESVFASMETGMVQGAHTYEDFLQATYNSSCSSCRCGGCCPVIVRNCPPKWVGSVIQPVSGWRGNVAVIVDWGCTAYNPCGCCPRGRLCTLNDHGFVYYINWGDGTHDVGYQDTIGPFQKLHQYDKSCRTRRYPITVHYCSNPGCPAERCCDTLYGVIYVSEDPQNPHPEVDFNSPLKPQ